MDLIMPSIIGVIGTIISLIILHLSWISKLKWTVKVEEIQRDKEIKVARIKQPRPKVKRMPKNYKDQIWDFVELLGNEKVQQLVGLLGEKEEDIGENKIFSTIMEIAKGFMEGAGKREGQEQVEEGAF